MYFLLWLTIDLYLTLEHVVWNLQSFSFMFNDPIRVMKSTMPIIDTEHNVHILSLCSSLRTSVCRCWMCSMFHITPAITSATLTHCRNSTSKPVSHGWIHWKRIKSPADIFVARMQKEEKTWAHLKFHNKPENPSESKAFRQPEGFFF